MNIQFCQGGRDITGDFYAAEDATEVRAWTDDATCLAAVTQDPAGGWHASASDVINWASFAGVAYPGWREALGDLLSSAGVTLPAGI